MPTPIELSLHNLLPTVHTLPPELVSLSSSLLAQSKSKAGTLKPEEEIGRTYACCHIACQRLGHKLALEIAKPTPPVKPKVYHKLHTYFNSVLATPKKSERKKDVTTPAKVHSGGGSLGRPAKTNPSVNAKSTPAKEGAHATTIKTTPTSGAKRKAASTVNDNENVLEFVMPMIRYLCKECDTPEAVPHVFAGVRSIYRASTTPDSEPVSKKRKTAGTAKSGHQPTKQSLEDTLASTVVAVFIAVVQKMYWSKPESVKEVIQLAEDHCIDHLEKLPPSFREKEEGDMETEALAFIANDLPAWTEMEWYENVPAFESSNTTVEEGNEDGIDDRPSKTPLRRKEKHGSKSVDGEEDVGAAGLLPGLGTMFQPAVDWLSEERKADFVEWKRLILKELDELGTE